MQFCPSPQVPALQYIGNVDPGGAAAEAGLCTGDFLLEVSQTCVCISGCVFSLSSCNSIYCATVLHVIQNSEVA